MSLWGKYARASWSAANAMTPMSTRPMRSTGSARQASHFRREPAIGQAIIAVRCSISRVRIGTPSASGMPYIARPIPIWVIWTAWA